MNTQNEHVKFWINKPLDNLELLKATYFQHSFVAHFHDEYAIGVTLSGAQDTKYQRQHQYMPAGTICVINPGELHTGFAHDSKIGWKYRMFYPSVALVQEIAIELGKHPTNAIFFPHLVIDDDTLFQQMLFAHQLFEDTHTLQLEREIAFFNIIRQMITSYADDTKPITTSMINLPYLRRAREFIDANYSQDITLQQIADTVHISRYHLLRMFQSHFGISPHAYLTHLRIKQAKHLLRSGQSIIDTAHQVGFSDQSHFTKRFKQVTGITPGQYQ